MDLNDLNQLAAIYGVDPVALLLSPANVELAKKLTEAKAILERGRTGLRRAMAGPRSRHCRPGDPRARPPVPARLAARERHMSVAKSRGIPGWPRALCEDWAAAYVGQLSPGTFRIEVDAGRIPAAGQLTAQRKAWLIEDLDAYLDRRSGKRPKPAHELPPEILVDEWDRACAVAPGPAGLTVPTRTRHRSSARPPSSPA
jgi:hypothetical protein